MSCNGCRVLRKGCSEDCILRPALEWIKDPDWQANATLFLVKFYGRAGLLNLINAGPSHLRQEIFRSLLYEACGRIINPVYGSTGLMCSGDWKRCQSSVDAVLRGKSLEIESASPMASPQVSATSISRPGDRRRVGSRVSPPEPRFTITGWSGEREYDQLDFAPRVWERAASHDSVSVETVEASLMNSVEEGDRAFRPVSGPSEIGLELTLGRAEYNGY